MTKKDLQVGYVVVHNNGDIAMVMPSKENGFIAINKDGYRICFYNFNDDLEYYYNNKLNIKEIYGFNKFYDGTFEISTEDRELLWQREKPIKEVTMSELKKMFGCEVKIINDK